MNKILFYSQYALNYFRLCNASEKYMVDYFDIEVQKVLRPLGFTYKKNPSFAAGECNLTTQSELRCYDLDHFAFQLVPSLPSSYVGVIYECII